MKYQGIVLTITKNIAIVCTKDFQCYYIKMCSTFFVGKKIEFSGRETVGKKQLRQD
ncbi:anti-sigma factor domain-containing protein [Acetivibrio cellulolyticus]|uniref:anti-sigma factor domain-containing protein n=1 Tax=Acetivibrio cellulolyticus TaxID=35830 RepID=UPI0001E2F096|nr:anti-sigma factor domain-containing protein [Acetivibrio cellulolyticus]